MPIPLSALGTLLRAQHIALLTFVAATCFGRTYDVVVYGGSSAGVTAAVQAARMGKSTLLVTQTAHVGGMTASGLGTTDIGNAATIGGLALAFYANVHRYYDASASASEASRALTTPASPFLVGPDNFNVQFAFEPHAAEAVMRDMLDRAGAELLPNEPLDRAEGVLMHGRRIARLRLRSGRIIAARVFVDATYEGDLLAAAHIPYRVGREDRAVYDESLAGVQPDPELTGEVDPYRIPGLPSSGLLPGVSPVPPGDIGAGDNRVQQYNLRLCVTNNPANRVPFEKPATYDPADYELLRRRLIANPGMGLGDVLKIGHVGGDKADVNGNGSFSTDLAGPEPTEWTEASDDRRAEIMQRYRDYTAGLFWFLTHDPSVPAAIRNAAEPWGLAADEFTDNDHWPWQLYVRESRRMIGEYVITQHDCDGERLVRDSVALASYPIDSHKVTLFVDRQGQLETEGYFFHGVEPWPISYRALVPPLDSCENLLVPICVSASHVAFNSIRMEPVYLMLGQAAGTAAALAVTYNVPVQRVPYRQLATQLLADGQILYWSHVPSQYWRQFEDTPDAMTRVPVQRRANGIDP
jgi:hypothetical protein